MKFLTNNSNAKGHNMNNIKRNDIGLGIITLVLIAVLITGCGGNNNAQTNQQSGFVTQSTALNPALQQQMQAQGIEVTQVQQTQQPMSAPQLNQQSRNDANVNFVRYTDPTQHAFTVDVPQGWTNQGRTKGIKNEITSLSPDGMILIQNGDVSLPEYVEASAYQPATAPGQCQNFYGACFEVRPFTSGIQFAAEYVGYKFGQICQNLSFTGQRKRPDWEQYIGQILQVDQINATGYGMQMGLDAGEVDFTCTLNGQQMRGTYMLVNRFMRFADGMGGNYGSWEPYLLSGFVAPAHQTDLALAISNRAQNSFKLDQNWLNAQARANRQSMQQRSSILDNSTSSSGSSDNYDRYNQMMRGTTNLYNSETGETQYNVDNNSNYYWQNSGSTYGTDLNETSDPFATQLEQQY